jgi:hypothetical protein
LRCKRKNAKKSSSARVVEFGTQKKHAQKDSIGQKIAYFGPTTPKKDDF